MIKRLLLVLLVSAPLVAGGCSTLTLIPEKSVEIRTSEDVLRGKEACRLEIMVDGEVRVTLKPVSGVTCALPADLLAPETP